MREGPFIERFLIYLWVTELFSVVKTKLLPHHAGYIHEEACSSRTQNQVLILIFFPEERKIPPWKWVTF